ncbi:uncharacterized protein [Littorina saxatilis]|uniref:uncharacterized protein isoform X2 n=1 Tax=Littorina saxatilis TaxID=31220 RepID=UPI0038B6A32B
MSVIWVLFFIGHFWTGAADDHSVLVVDPPSFLSGITKNVQLTCRPPVGEDVARVLTLQVIRERSLDGASDPVATFLTSAATPLVEKFGVLLNASVSASYDAAQARDALLRVDLPDPAEIAAGRYTCSVETQDSHGLLHRYLSHRTTLTSLFLNGSVPLFYQAILLELRKDLDTLTSDLNKVNVQQTALEQLNNESESKLSAITADQLQLTGLKNDINAGVNGVDNQVTVIRSSIERLRDITPVEPVNFYAFFSSQYAAVGNNANIVFNSLEQHTDTSYSTSTGVFTVPVNGTYFFRTGVTGDTATHSASIVINDKPVASLVSYDDYGGVNQATACVVVKLTVADTVRVVKKTGSTSSVFGYYPNAGHNHVSYFVGTLQWSTSHAA